MPDPLHLEFPRGTEGASTGPSAYFEPSANIAQVASLQFTPDNPEGRIFLGVIDATVQDTRLADSRVERHVSGGKPIGVPDDRNILTVAGSRAGKGRSTLIPNLITYPGSILAVDPKGDLARITASWRADILGQKVVVLDPFGAAGDVTGRHGGGFNPLTILHQGSTTRIEDAGSISDALIVPSPGQKDPHWEESAKQFLEAMILHVATCLRYEGERHLVTVYEIIMGDPREVRNEMMENPAENFAIGLMAGHFFNMPESERGSVLSTLRRHLRFLGYPQIQNCVKAHSFDLRELKTQTMTVYLSLPAMRMGTCARWLRLFVNLALDAFEAEATKPRYPVLMCLDEFATLGTLKSLEDAAGQIAGLGCKLWPILQDLGQLKALYGERWETFIGNAGILQFFGNSDMQTLEWISNRLGETTIRTASQNQPGYNERARDGATGDSFGEHGHKLLTAEEISRFFGRDDRLVRQLVIRPTWAPMVLQRAFYDKHDMFLPFQQYMDKNNLS